MELDAVAVAALVAISADEYVRPMTECERGAWNYALLLSVLITDRERRYDRFCGIANDAEVRSIRMEQRGHHEEAAEDLLVAELFDAAAHALA